MKTYKDGLLKALEILGANECDADGYHACSQQEVYKDLIKAEADSIPMDAEVKPEIAEMDCPFCGEDSLTLKNLKYHLKFCCNNYSDLQEED